MILVNIGCGAYFDPRWINLDGDPLDSRVEPHDCRENLRFADGSVDAAYSSHLIEHLSPKFALHFLQECFRVLKPGGVLRLATPDLEKLAFEYLKNLYQACSGNLSARDRHEWLVIELFDQFSRESSGGLMLDYWKRTPMPGEDYVLERMGEEVKNFLSVFRATKSKEKGHDSEPEHFAAHNKPNDNENDSGERLTFEKHRWLYDRLSLAQLLAKIGFQEVDPVAHNISRIPDFGTYHLDTLENGSIRKPDSFFIEAIKPE